MSRMNDTFRWSQPEDDEDVIADAEYSPVIYKKYEYACVGEFMNEGDYITEDHRTIYNIQYNCDVCTIRRTTSEISRILFLNRWHN